MRAFHIPAADEQPNLAELPTPEVSEGHVLIKVEAAGLNAIDHAIAAGMMAGMARHEYPLVLGRDAAGVVERVGAGVDHVAPGDEVFGHILFTPPIQAGALADFAVLPAASVCAKPANLDFVTAAAIPLAGAAAVAAVDAVAPRPGQVVLVNGATGGVGSYAIQLLAARGATVVATGAPAEADRLTKLGATTVVDYTTGSVIEQVKATYPDGADALINLTGYTIDDVPLAAVRKNGKVATTTMTPDADALAAAGLTGTSIFAQPVAGTISTLAQQAADGTLTVDVTTVLPLDQAADGLATIAAGRASGKIVVTINDQ